MCSMWLCVKIIKKVKNLFFIKKDEKWQKLEATILAHKV